MKKRKKKPKTAQKKKNRYQCKNEKRQKEKVTCIPPFFLVELDKLAWPDSPPPIPPWSDLGHGAVVPRALSCPSNPGRLTRRNSQPSTCALGSLRQDRPMPPTPCGLCLKAPLSGPLLWIRKHSQHVRGGHRKSFPTHQGWCEASYPRMISLFHLHLPRTGTLGEARSQWPGQLPLALKLPICILSPAGPWLGAQMAPGEPASRTRWSRVSPHSVRFLLQPWINFLGLSSSNH